MDDYSAQLIAVEARLAKDPNNEEFLSLKRDLIELISLSGDGLLEDVELQQTSNTTANTKQQRPTVAESSVKVAAIEEEHIPDVEWWDKPLLRGRSLDEVILRLEQMNEQPEQIFDGISRLVEHPPLKRPPGPDNSAVQVPIFLTKKERKKLRRQNRKVAEMEKQEKIKLGLLPKPEPKLKHSNIMYALGNEAITNPTLADRIVREQVEKRKLAHIEHNESKKLTLEEKRAKKSRKIQEDLSVTGTWTSVFRVLEMNSVFYQKKVKLNAEQLEMTGALVLYKDINLVVVEGGPKQNRRFKHLMMDRIKWSEQPIGAPKSASGPKFNRCLLVWEGQVKQRSFRFFKVKHMTTDSEAREFFKKAGVENYWDLAFRMSILESIEET